MKNGIKIILVLVAICFILPIARSYAKDDDKTAFTITTEEKFTLTFIDTSAIMKVRIWLKYDSKEDKYTIAVYKQEPNEKLDSFDLNGEKLYNGLKEKLTAIAQNKKIEKALTEASNSDVYLWLLSANPANMVDRNTLSGKLALNQQIMVMKKGYSREYDDYSKRALTVQKESSKYIAAQARIIKVEQEVIRTKDSLIALLKRHKSNIAAAHQEAQIRTTKVSNLIAECSVEIERLNKNITTWSDSLDTINIEIEQSRNNIQRTIDSLEIQKIAVDTAIKRAIYIEIKDSISKNTEKIIALKHKITDFSSELTSLPQYDMAITQLEQSLTIIRPDSIEKMLKDFAQQKLIRADDPKYGSELIHLLRKFESDREATEQIIRLWQQQSIYMINKVSLQFERGFLERIQVWVTVDDKQEIFENVYAIGFSSVSNFKNFKDIKLFARNSDIAFPYIYLSDVFSNYDNYLHNYTRDYSPADTAINEVDPADEKILNLSTERLINVFDSKIYTDLRGIAENQPNGLVQIDVNKRFNLNTHRRQVFSSRNNFGYFNYITLWGALTKIEKEDRVLQLRNDRVVVNNTLVSPSYATNLDFRQYEMLSFGGDINLLLFDRPDTKFTFYFDLGARYGLTKVLDSTLKVENGEAVVDANKFSEYDANTLTFFPRISAEVMSQQRVGFTVSYQYHYTYLLSNNLFKQVASYAKSQTSSTLLDTRARGSHMVELYVRIQTSENDRNKFFLRGRLFMQNGDMNTSFSQLQLGYSYNLFYKK